MILETDLAHLLDRVIVTLAERIPSFSAVSDDLDRQSLALPACLVEVVDLVAEPDEAPPTGQIAMTVSFTARIILGFRTPQAQRQALALANAVAAVAHRHRWGLPVEPARVTIIAPDDFDPAAEQHVVWSVSWEQIVYLGPDPEIPDAPQPRVMLGISPRIGPDHVEDYEEIEAAPR